jgi:hypothetical protein
LPVFPFGDINKLVNFFLLQKYQISLDTRFSFLDSVLPIILELEHLCELFGLESQEFVDYFKKLYFKIQEYLIIFPEQNQKGCIGNFWHQFLLYKFGSVQMISAFYRSKGIFDFELCFSHTARQTLVATDIEDGFLQGEDKIDSHNLALVPNSTRLLKNQPSLELLKDLDNADFVILPHGSICNWLPLINCPDILQILKNKPILAMMNLFYLPNELEYFEYMQYLFELGLLPIVIGPKIKHLIFDQKLLIRYKKQQKRQNIIQNLSHNVYLGALEIITENANKIEGIKHCPKSVAQTLKMLIK